MNDLSYASLEASKKLKEAGLLQRKPKIGDRVSVDCEGDTHEGFIVDEEEVEHFKVRFDGSEEAQWVPPWLIQILYSMAEVWRELPEKAQLYKGNTLSEAYFWKGNFSKVDANPTDALIYLLIFVTQQKGESHD